MTYKNCEIPQAFNKERLEEVSKIGNICERALINANCQNIRTCKSCMFAKINSDVLQEWINSKEYLAHTL